MKARSATSTRGTRSVPRSCCMLAAHLRRARDGRSARSPSARTALPVATAVWCVPVIAGRVIAAVVRVLERPDHATGAVRRRLAGAGRRAPDAHRRVAVDARRTPLAVSRPRTPEPRPAAVGESAPSRRRAAGMRPGAVNQQRDGSSPRRREAPPETAATNEGDHRNELRRQSSAPLRSDRRRQRRSHSSSSCSSSSGTAASSNGGTSPASPSAQPQRLAHVHEQPLDLADHDRRRARRRGAARPARAELELPDPAGRRRARASAALSTLLILYRIVHHPSGERHARGGVHVLLRHQDRDLARPDRRRRRSPTAATWRCSEEGARDLPLAGTLGGTDAAAPAAAPDPSALAPAALPPRPPPPASRPAASAARRRRPPPAASRRARPRRRRRSRARR